MKIYVRVKNLRKNYSIRVAEKEMRQRNWSKAASKWELLLNRYKSAAPAGPYVRLSICYRQLKQFELSQKIVEKGLSYHPNYCPLFNERVEISIDQKDWPEAVVLCKKTIDKFGKDTPTELFLRLSRAYRHLSKLGDAESIVREILKKSPRNRSALIEQAEITNAKKDWEKSLVYWENIIKVFGKDANPYMLAKLVAVYRNAGEIKKAENLLSESLKKFSKSNELLVEQAELATEKQDWATALNLWEAVLPRLNSTAQGFRAYTRLQISVIKRLIDTKAYKKKVDKYSVKSGKKKNKIAIVTAFSNGYDVLKPHEVLDERFDYIAFTDSKCSDYGFYDIRPLPETGLDDARAIRYIKSQPHKVLPSYDLVVWIDTSLMIVGDIYPLLDKFMKSDRPIGASIHPLRKSVYEEFEAATALSKDNPDIMKKQMNYYKSIGFKSNNLAECGFLTFNLKGGRKEVESAMETWWEQICRFSKRDQLSFTYSLSSNNVSWYPLLRPPKNVRNHPSFIFAPHNIEHPTLDVLNDRLG